MLISPFTRDSAVVPVPFEMSNPLSQEPSETLIRMTAGYRSTQALYVVAKLGIADLLRDGPKDSDEIARKVGAHPRSLFRLMRAVAAMGVFTQDPSGRFGLTPISQLLRTDNSKSLRHFVIMGGEEHYRAAGELLHTVRTGKTAFNHLYGKSFFEYLAGNPESSATFNSTMAETVARFANPIESYNFEGKHLVVDVGGGRGVLIASILRANPNLRGILFDLPQGVVEAATHLKSQGLRDRCEIRTGSFFDSIPSDGDVYIMSRILHDFPDEKASVILRNCRKAIPEEGTLLIRDGVVPEGDLPSNVKQLDLTMLFMLGGAERSEAEWRVLLQASRFAVKKIRMADGYSDLIEATPA